LHDVIRTWLVEQERERERETDWKSRKRVDLGRDGQRLGSCAVPKHPLRLVQEGQIFSMRSGRKRCTGVGGWEKRRRLSSSTS